MTATAISFPPACAMASVQSEPRCPYGCALPMQPVPDAADTHRCPGCGAIVARLGELPDDTRLAPTPADDVALALAALETARDILGEYEYVPDDFARLERAVVSAADAIQVEGLVRAAITRLTAAPLASHAEAVHALAIEAAAAVCERRGRSLFYDSANALASLEARKCATAVRKLRPRAVLVGRPELLTPEPD